MNRYGQWEVGQVAPSKDDIFDQDFAPSKKCNFAVNKRVTANFSLRPIEPKLTELLPFR